MIKKIAICLCLLALVSSAAMAVDVTNWTYKLGANPNNDVKISGGYNWAGVYNWGGTGGWLPATPYGASSGEANIVVRATVQTWEQLALSGSLIEYNVASAGVKTAKVGLSLYSNQGEDIYLSDGHDYITGAGKVNDLHNLTLALDAYGTDASAWPTPRYTTSIPMKWYFKVVSANGSSNLNVDIAGVDDDPSVPGGQVSGNSGHTGGIYFHVGDNLLPGNIDAEITNTITVAPNQAPGYYDMDPVVVCSPTL